MVAAKKLYPDATIVFPGSQEKSMRDFFLESTAYAIESARLKHIDIDRITRLIMVDNRNPHRLGKLAEALQRPGISIHVYDHHPAMASDVKGELEVTGEVGATITLMVEILRSKGIPISSLDATIFALGIYEETGALTYLSTTVRDAEAAAWLIGQGANLNIVADFITRDLTPEQNAVLNDLVNAAGSYEINGVHVVIAALASPHFLPDLAALAHKIRDRKNLDVLFLVVQMGGKTHLIGRSRLPQVNVGRVLEQFGGGGHLTAGSAATKDMTYLEAKERLVDALKNHITPTKTAGDIMTSPVKTVRSGRTIEQAGEDMTRFSVNVLPVVDGDRFLGIITREVVQKDVAFLASRPAPLLLSANEFVFGDDSQFDGQNPPEAAMISYYLKKRHLVGDLKLEIYDEKGTLVSTLPGGKRRGVNRVAWPMRGPAPKMPKAADIVYGSLFGPRPAEGTYTVRMIKGKDTYESKVSLVPDPRSRATAEDRRLQRDTVAKLHALLGRMTFTVERIADLRDQARARAAGLPGGAALRKRLEALADAMEARRAALVSTKESEGGISGDEKLREELGTLYGNVNSYEGRPTESQVNRMGVLRADLEAAYKKFEASADKEIAALNPQLSKRKLDPLAKLTPEEWAKRQKK